MKYRVKATPPLGVPVTFLYGYNNHQFEVLGLAADKRCDESYFIKAMPTYLDAEHKAFMGFILDAKATYTRLLIKFK